MDRREFIETGLVMLVTGNVMYSVADYIKNEEVKSKNKEQEDIINKIYNEYPNMLHISKTKSVTDEDKELNVSGYGIVINNQYVSVAHIVDSSEKEIKTPFGLVHQFNTIKSKSTTLYGVELEDIYISHKDDVAVLGIPSIINVNNKFTLDDICFDDPKLGEDVYIVGNPGLQGVNVRKAKVSDLDFIEHYENNKNYFGLDKGFMGGDSGTIAVNKGGKVLGINSFVFGGIFGYSIKMKAYEKYLK